MLDERMRMMLEVANTLTAEDLDFLRADGCTPITPEKPLRPAPKRVPKALDPPEAEPICAMPRSMSMGNSSLASRGAYERQRTRESKTSTACLGEERLKHDWWPLGTELVGQVGNEVFTAVVVENPAVKSGRSLQITSGAAQGRICITPTRAAMEATEAYRQANNLGRGGGVTNGWLFWQPQGGK